MRIIIRYSLQAVLVVCMLFMLSMLYLDQEDEVDEPKVTHIEESFQYLYWHENARYTVKNLIGDTVVSKRFGIWVKIRIGGTRRDIRSVTLKVLPDLEIPKYRCDVRSDDDDYADCVIYIRSIDDMRTADWNHGKFGSGTTTRLQ